MFLRLVCLKGGTASNREFQHMPPGVAEVLAYKYGCVLTAVLEGVQGTSDALYDSFIVEITHLMSTPQVSSKDSCSS